jgi:hypothetical protein
MPTQVQFRRGSTAQNNSFTGAAGELSINTSNSTIRVHDGSTAGGSELATVSYASNVTNFSTGTLSTARLAVSGVTAATYGNATLIPSFTVDTFGRITSASNVSVTISADAVSGLATSATTDTTNATNISSGTLSSARLATSGVAAGTYGGTAVEGVFTVDTFGRITSASNVTAQVANTNITGLITSGQIASVANTQITGNITASQIAPTGVTAATYGGASSIPAITIDAQGRITSASNVAVSAGVTAGKSIALAIVFGG